MLKYDSIAELVNEAEKRGLKLSELVLKTQAAMTEKTEEEMFETMERSLQVMKESVQDGLDKDKRSASGLTGGDAYKLNEALKAGKNIAGHFFGNAMVKAVAVAQTNACMGRIVASPTAGSCGILPSALLTLQEEKNISVVPVMAFTTFEMLSLFNKSDHDCAWLLVAISINTAIKAIDKKLFFIFILLSFNIEILVYVFYVVEYINTSCAVFRGRYEVRRELFPLFAQLT